MSHVSNPGLAAAIPAIFFFLFLTAAAVAGIISDFRKRQLKVEALKFAIEHGERLDPAVIERLVGQQKDDPQDKLRLLPHYVRLAGTITTASGVGVALSAFFVAHVWPIALYPVLGAGVVAVCVGVGLLLAAHGMNRSRAFDGPADRAA